MTTLAVPPWTPPLDSSELADVLAGLRRWTPFDGDAVLKDVGVVLDDVAPREEEDCALRLVGHLVTLVDIAVASNTGQQDTEAGLLVQRDRGMRATQAPDGYWQAVAYLRRLAWSVNELLERLTVTGCIREAV
ncbi:DUF6415 family natural product biosynthesis protein [Streptomyces sp. NPDC033538]|uniref:DUF6415 family natural product biosynthesis protein n=1 Tax=Streptomyces sp. NPDC033538 TaxID=3155367 RepID=UPI0033D1837C